MSKRSAAVQKFALTSWERVWYTLQCVAFGAGYLAKIPAKKALSDFGLGTMTAAERFWYVLMLGGGYLAKVPVMKALSETSEGRPLGRWEQFWYSVSCLYLGAGYFAKVHSKKALSDFGWTEMTDGERTWYTILCLPFGAAYFAKIPVAKAISELRQGASPALSPGALAPEPLGEALEPELQPAVRSVSEELAPEA